MTLLVTMVVTFQLSTAASISPLPRINTNPAKVLDLRCSIPWHLALRERWFSLDGFEIKLRHSGTDNNVTLARISATMVSPRRGEALNAMADTKGLVRATDILDPRPPYLSILTPLDSTGVYYCEVEYSPLSTSGMKTLTYKVNVNTKFLHETFVATDVCFSGKLIEADEVNVTWPKVASRRSHEADTGVSVERIAKIGDAFAKPRILVSIHQQDIVDTHRSYGTLLVKLDSPALGVSDSEYTLRLFVEHEQCYPDCVYSCEVGGQRCNEEDEITEISAFENCSVSWILFITFILFLLIVTLLLAVGCVLIFRILRKCPQCRQKITDWKKCCSRPQQEGAHSYTLVSTGATDQRELDPASGNTSNRSLPQDTHTLERAEGSGADGDLSLHKRKEAAVIHHPVRASSDNPENHVGSDKVVADINIAQPEPRCSTFSNTQNHDNLHKSNNLGDVQPLMESANGRNTGTDCGFTDGKEKVCVDLPLKQVSPSGHRKTQSPQSGRPHQKHLNGTRRKKQNQNNTANNSFNTTQSRKHEQQAALSKHMQSMPAQSKFQDNGSDGGSDYASMGATGGFTSSIETPALSNNSDRSASNSARPRHQSQSAESSRPSVKFTVQRSMSDGNSNHSPPVLTTNSTEVESETDTPEDLVGITDAPTSVARHSFPATDSGRTTPTGDRLSYDSEDIHDLQSIMLRNEKVGVQEGGNGSRSKTV